VIHPRPWKTLSQRLVNHAALKFPVTGNLCRHDLAAQKRTRHAHHRGQVLDHVHMDRIVLMPMADQPEKESRHQEQRTDTANAWITEARGFHTTYLLLLRPMPLQPGRQNLHLVAARLERLAQQLDLKFSAADGRIEAVNHKQYSRQSLCFHEMLSVLQSALAIIHARSAGVGAQVGKRRMVRGLSPRWYKPSWVVKAKRYPDSATAASDT